MPPFIFQLTEARIVRGSGLGTGPSFQGMVPAVGVKLLITGVTKDGSGTIIGSATVKLYRAVDDVYLETCVSDPVTGAYSFSSVGLSETYYAVAYKAGVPDLSGTTVNTLVGV
jgi:hypothetical protein